MSKTELDSLLKDVREILSLAIFLNYKTQIKCDTVIARIDNYFFEEAENNEHNKVNP